jgi:hypothetical protein
MSGRRTRALGRSFRGVEREAGVEFRQGRSLSGRSSPTVIGDPSVSFSASCLGLPVTLASRDSRQKSDHDHGRCPARTGDLLLVRREHLLRFTAACRSGRSVSEESHLAAALCCGLPLPERFHTCYWLGGLFRDRIAPGTPGRSGIVLRQGGPGHDCRNPDRSGSSQLGSGKGPCARAPEWRKLATTLWTPARRRADG